MSIQEYINKCCDIVLTEMMVELHDNGKLPNKEVALDDFENLLYFSDCAALETSFQREENDVIIQEARRKISACCDALHRQCFKLLVMRIINTLKEIIVGDRDGKN